MIKLGVIGYGERIAGVIEVMQECHPEATIVAIADPKQDQIREKMADKGKDVAGISFYAEADEMLDKQDLDGVLIGTRCTLHTKMAKKVLARDLPLFLEKPVATNMEDLLSLKEAGEKSKSQVVVSFPLRATSIVSLVKEIIDSGQIGTVEHVQAWNNVNYGRVYYQHWYRDENETNGLWLQKATHDFDYINYLIGLEPRLICAMQSKQIFKGNHPAGLRCMDCDEAETCLEHPNNQKRAVNDWVCDPSDARCLFAVDTGNEDSGSAIVQYDSGMHVSYSQNFFVRKDAAARGARLIGYKGTVEFDWYKKEARVVMHHIPRVDRYTFTNEGGHFGGDTVLTDSFYDIILGRADSVAPLSAGLISVLICLKAKESAKTKTFQEIKWP